MTIEIDNNFVHFISEGQAFFRTDLKKINKHVSKTIGPNTADVLIRFLQVWDEEEFDSILTNGEDVPKRTPDELVCTDSRPSTRRLSKTRTTKSPAPSAILPKTRKSVTITAKLWLRAFLRTRRMPPKLAKLSTKPAKKRTPRA